MFEKDDRPLNERNPEVAAMVQRLTDTLAACPAPAGVDLYGEHGVLASAGEPIVIYQGHLELIEDTEHGRPGVTF